MTADRLQWRDLLIFGGLVLLFAALYSQTLLGCIFANDGAMLADWLVLPGGGFAGYHNVCYQPCARCLAALLPDALTASVGDPLLLPKLMSLLPAAVGVGLACVFCRQVGAKWPASVAGAVLLGVTPVTWFFASAIEVHALNFMVVLLCACATMALPWHRPVLATLLTASFFWLPYASHQSAPVLGPGWVLLVQLARTRRNPPFRLTTLFAIGVVLLASLVFGHMLTNWVRGLGFTVQVSNVAGLVSGWRREFSIAIVWTEVLGPLCLLLPMTVLGLANRAVDGWLRAVALVLFVPAMGCVLWWGVAEHGGYLLGQAFVLAALAARWWSAVPTRLAVVSAGAVIGLQAAVGWHFVRDFDRQGAQLSERTEQVGRLLGDEGLLVSANDNAPSMQIFRPRIRELKLLPTLTDDQVAPAVWLDAFYPVLRSMTGAQKFAFECSYRLRDDIPPRVRESLSLLERALQRDYRVTEAAHPSWPMWIVETR